MPRGSKTLKQAYQLQELAFNAAKQVLELPAANLDEADQRARSAANLIRAWESSVDRVRVIRGRPLPGSLRPVAKPRKPSRASSPAGTARPAVQPDQSGIAEPAVQVDPASPALPAPAEPSQVDKKA